MSKSTSSPASSCSATGPHRRTMVCRRRNRPIRTGRSRSTTPAVRPTAVSMTAAVAAVVAAVGAGGGVAVGVAACTYEPELCIAPPPPPPPPPPQDCYAVQTCTPNPAPRALRDDEHITQRPGETVNLKDVSAKDTIDQPTPTEQQLLHALGDDTDGLDPSANENGSNAENQGSSTGDNAADNDAARILGKPANPEPGESESSPAAGGSGAGAGG